MICISQKSLKVLSAAFKNAFVVLLGNGLNVKFVHGREVNIMVVFGLILLIIGAVLKIGILWSIGVIILIIGLVLWVLGAMGHAVGGRKHYY